MIRIGLSVICADELFNRLRVAEHQGTINPPPPPPPPPHPPPRTWQSPSSRIIQRRQKVTGTSHAALIKCKGAQQTTPHDHADHELIITSENYLIISTHAADF